MSRGIVTRTIRTLAIDGTFADTENNRILKKRIFLPYRKFTTKYQIEKYVRKFYTGDEPFISVENWETEKKLFGCTEDHFMTFAVPYDPITRKPIEEKEN